MKSRLRYIIIILSIFFISITFANPKLLTIPNNEALAIGMKIWFNESGGKVSGLTMWNKDEKCASLGIGHFIWYPYPIGSASDGFPQLIKYMEERRIIVPIWLRADYARYSVWQNREEFMQAEHSLQMNELRQFLLDTIAVQAQFIAHQLETVLPKLLAGIPPHERPYVCEQFYKLAKTETGLYAMMDYLNFRGAGAVQTAENRNTGLLQVLRDMRYAPRQASALDAFVWSAKNALMRRLAHAPENTHEARWIVGWLKRVDRYSNE